MEYSQKVTALFFSYICLVILFVFDSVTTAIIISNGGYEMNLIMSLLITHTDFLGVFTDCMFIKMPVIIFLLGVVLLATIPKYRDHINTVIGVFIVSDFLYALILFNNTIVIWRIALLGV